MEMFLQYFTKIWGLFESTRIPLVNASVAQLSIALLLIGFSFTIIKLILGIGKGFPDAVGAVSQGVSELERKKRQDDNKNRKRWRY